MLVASVLMAILMVGCTTTQVDQVRSDAQQQMDQARTTAQQQLQQGKQLIDTTVNDLRRYAQSAQTTAIDYKQQFEDRVKSLQAKQGSASSALVMPQPSVRPMSDFGRCIAQKGVKLYGLPTCGYTAQQKDILGTMINDVQYVSCDIDTALCREKGVRATPSRVDAQGNIYEGAHTQAEIEQFFGCK